MKRWIAFGMTLVVILSLVLGLGWYRIKTGPERAVEKMLNALQSGNLSKAEKYTKDGTLSFGDRTWKAKDLYKAMFSTLSYTVSAAQTGSDNAAVTLSVTVVDMDSLVTATTLDLLDGALSGERRYSKSFYTEITKAIKSGQVEYVTATAIACVVKTDKGWRVDLVQSSKLADAITGGMGELIGY